MRLGEHSLRRTLTEYCAYYHNWRTHLSLGKDTRNLEEYSRSLTVK
jgi:hypothetical protein